jgi:hypothetical protein
MGKSLHMRVVSSICQLNLSMRVRAPWPGWLSWAHTVTKLNWMNFAIVAMLVLASSLIVSIMLEG